MNYTEINKEIITKHFARLWEELNSGDDDLSCSDIKIETSPSGDPTLCIKGIYVHSPRDPLREGQRIAGSGTENGPVIILGFGLGYSAGAAVKIPDLCGKPVIIIEKHKNLLLKAFELRDFSDFLSNNKVLFVTGSNTEGITDALSIAYALMPEKQPPLIIRNKALNALDEKWYKHAEDKIRTWAMRDDVNKATHKRFGQRWVRNLSRNMNFIRDLPGVLRLEGLASERFDSIFSQEHESKEKESGFLPVFMAAAGPSLDKIKPMLCDIYERCIIVAMDTSLRFFVQNGIQPDFVIVVDPQFWNNRHLDRCVFKQTGKQTALVAESAVYPPVLNLPFKHKFLCSSLFPLGTFIETRVDNKGRLAAGGSVATTAWDFARILGGNEIWIAGLDLAFPGLKTHFRGARFEESSNSQSGRFNPVEKWVVRALRDGKPFKAFSGNGSRILTDQRLSLYAAWFENQFRQNPQIKNYGLYQEGLAISGIIKTEVQNFLALPQVRKEINRRIELAFNKTETEFNEPEEKNKRAQRFDSAVSVLKNGLENIKKTAEEGAETARRALRYPMNQSQQNKVLKELDRITLRLTESEVKEIAGFLFPPTEEEKDETDPFKAYLKSSLKLFTGIREAVTNTIF